MKTILQVFIVLSSIFFIQPAISDSNYSKNSLTRPISAIFDTYTLVECRFKTPLFLDLYTYGLNDESPTLSSGVLRLDYPKREAFNPEITTGYDTLRFTGVKAIKTFERKDEKQDESVWSIDIDVFKHDIHILRFAKFGIDDYEEGIDYGGFYYIVKGLPSVNIPKLKKLTANNDLGAVGIEKTAGNNTRVRCIL